MTPGKDRTTNFEKVVFYVSCIGITYLNRLFEEGDGVGIKMKGPPRIVGL